MIQNLLKEIKLFKSWAYSIDSSNLFGEWEMYYDNWDNIYRAFRDVITNCSCEGLDDKVTEDLLYIIARDNEDECLIDQLVESKTWFMFLCEKSLTSNYDDAKWQFASKLSNFSEDPRSKKFIIMFINDNNEYVSRRALLQLPFVYPEKVEYYSKIYWDKNTETQEYYRMAILDILNETKSNYLDFYIKKAIQDERKCLVKHAKDIQKDIFK